MSASFYDLLKYAKTGIAAPDMTAYDKMRAVAMGGGAVKTLTGVPPLSFTGNGKPLISWSMLGNGQQSGTPAPDAPIMPQFVGVNDGGNWKIPITCAGQTQNVYLGEVQTTRKIKKLVLDGTEDWILEYNDHFYIDDRLTGAKWSTLVTCTHQQSIVPNHNARENVYISGTGRLNFTTQMITHTIEAFTDWLKSQYSAGTPVTVWYILATPKIAIVNEPLCKIGNYTDELHSTDAGVSIPTVKGANTLSIGTSLQPSSMTITYCG